jgi:hypothetical protein
MTIARRRACRFPASTPRKEPRRDRPQNSRRSTPTDTQCMFPLGWWSHLTATRGTEQLIVSGSPIRRPPENL